MSDAPAGSTWKQRATITIESNKRNVMLGTINEDDIATLNSFNGTTIELNYTKSSDGKYNNIVEGSIKQHKMSEAEMVPSDLDDKDEAMMETEDVLDEQPIEKKVGKMPLPQTERSESEHPNIEIKVIGLSNLEKIQCWNVAVQFISRIDEKFGLKDTVQKISLISNIIQKDVMKEKE